MDTHSIIAAHYVTRDRRVSEEQFYQEHSCEALVYFRLAARRLSDKLSALAGRDLTRRAQGMARRKLEA